MAVRGKSGPKAGKTGRVGEVGLNAEARAALLNRARFRASHCPDAPWVFCDEGGRRIVSVKKAFGTAVARAGLEDVHPHDLRRTFGSWLVQAGVDIRRVSELMRHSDISVTARVYAHLAPNDLRMAVDVLDTPGKGSSVSRSGFTLPEMAGEEGGGPAATG